MLVPLWVTSAHAQEATILAKEQFDADGMHSSVGFVATVLRFVKVRGRFREYDVAMTYDATHIERSSITAVIASKSISTDMNFRDNHLRSPDFLDTAAFPTIEFRSERIVRVGPQQVRVTGPLTLHGVTRPITFLARVAPLPQLGRDGSEGVELETTLRIRRSDFGIAGTNKFNAAFNPATNLVSDSVAIAIELDMAHAGYLDRTLENLGASLGGGTPPGVVDTVSRVLQTHGVAAAIDLYRTLETTKPQAFNYGAEQLDILGQVLAAHHRLPDALAIFLMNVEEYPTSDQALESLGAVQALSGDGAAALATYRRAAAVAPTSASAQEMVRRLTVQGHS
jgi:polyisoprenoid-binding protein YceI